eukprot:CAMPEP_0177360658 /NCGR_PEP_ID=MMETSP0368-20130122/36771_1 /TAXON_ID=447022 ORGANISM="Scrippsiella hangoei-like, Strain SHHI-4" /NCGR_SAMPLE_ID=MMETSP0368 /ASSEMBLY_ACC=CAM_ASM_000363 /LENGTH=167 /DNA_ID=CAMNT_0018823261 /DNA_START=363 /DNA_END=863 /DNA_ORIENTATION=-
MTHAQRPLPTSSARASSRAYSARFAADSSRGSMLGFRKVSGQCAENSASCERVSAPSLGTSTLQQSWHPFAERKPVTSSGTAPSAGQSSTCSAPGAAAAVAGAARTRLRCRCAAPKGLHDPNNFSSSPPSDFGTTATWKATSETGREYSSGKSSTNCASSAEAMARG